MSEQINGEEGKVLPYCEIPRRGAGEGRGRQRGESWGGRRRGKEGEWEREREGRKIGRRIKLGNHQLVKLVGESLMRNKIFTLFVIIMKEK